MESTYASTAQQFIEIKPKPFKVSSARKVSSSNGNISETYPMKQCKICLVNQPQQSKLFSPCLCSGSLQFIHQECFKQYLKTKFQKYQNDLQSKLKEQLKCQICHQKYDFSLQIQRKCGGLQYFKTQVKRKKFLAILLLFVFILILISSSLVVYNILGVNKKKSSNDYEGSYFGYIGSGIALSIIAGAYLLTKDFIIQKKLALIIRDKHKRQILISMTPLIPTDNTRASNVIEESQIRMNNNL